MRKILFAISLIVLVGMAACVATGQKKTDLPPSSIVMTKSGPVQGVMSEDEGISLFSGLPYAAPPVGDLRWAPPAPVAPWTETRNAAVFSPECLQYRESLVKFMSDIAKGLGLAWWKQKAAAIAASRAPTPNESEDCLYLNIRTGNLNGSEPKPVMVWIHGGFHLTGAGSSETYQSNSLVKNGVVLVTINYRLGPMGYMAHPALTAASPNKSSGNYGTMDQIAALRWVRNNIAAFGGDAHNITVFGESAGAQSITELMASPMSEGTFDKIILQSGTSTGTVFHLDIPIDAPPINRIQSAHESGLEMMRDITPSGDEATAQELRNVPAAKIIAEVGNKPHLSGSFLPVVDGWFLPKQIGAAVQDGDLAKVPMLAGFNADEGTLFYTGSPTRLHWNFPQGYETRMARFYELYGQDRGDRLADLYGLKNEETYDAGATQMLGDDVFAVHMRFFAKQRAHEGQDNYMYFFSRVPPSKKQTLGAFHASEIVFVFDAHHPLLKTPDEDRALTKQMGQYWANFARTGNPNGEGLPEWPKYHPDTERWLNLDHEVKTITNLRKEKLDVLEEVLLENIQTVRDIAATHKQAAGKQSE